MKRIVLVIMAAFLAMQVFSQTFEGIVLNADTQQPIINANIVVKNSTIGTVSDNDGFFEISLRSPENITIQISCVGFKTRELNLNNFMVGKQEIFLQPVSIQLNKSIVITASRNESISFQTPDAVSLITQQELKNNPSRSMAEALIGVTGVWMQKTNHGGGSPFVRGFTGNQTLLLIDGIRLNNATFRYGPNQYFNTIDVFSVDRVEVVRGKGSVLYGSDALGGVINVITHTPEYTSGKKRFGGRGKLKYMNKGMEKSGMGELYFQSKDFAFSGNINYKDFGDIYAGGKLGYERPSGYDENGVTLKSKLRFSDNWQIISAFQYLIQNDVPRYDQVAQRGYQFYTFDPQIHRLAYVKMEHFSENPLFRKIKLLASNQYSDETRKMQKEGSFNFQTENDVVKTNGFSVETWSAFNNKWDAVSGIEFYSDRVESVKIITDSETAKESYYRGLYPDNSGMKNLAFFTQHTLKNDKLKLNFGGRFNTFSIHSVDDEFGEITLKPSSLVGNISIQYFISPKQQFILSSNTGFRAPNINDISSFGLFDYGIEIPSTQLSPEKTVTVEGGYKQLGERFSMSFSVFNTRLKDQIVRVESTYMGSEYIDIERVYKKENVAQSNIIGVEFESGITLNQNFSIINNINWLNGKNLENGEPMRRIPPLNGKLAMQYSKSKIFGEVEFLFAAKQDRLSGGDIDDHRIPEGGTPGWEITNLKAGYTWKNISVNVGLQNIFNRAYRFHGSGVDGYGRSLWVTLQFEV